MRLLICTQKVAQNDDVLGFMHGWIEHFARSCERVSVICLEEGSHALPGNVAVYSLGKERRRSRLLYVLTFYHVLFRLRGEYDAVLVHMNPEYMILGGIWWRLSGVYAGLWYNHKMGGLRARLGILLAQKVFYTSPFAFAARFKKAQRMPAGIDTERFSPDLSKRKPHTILSLGRLDPVKKLEVVVKALQELAGRNISFTAHFYGSPTADQTYALEIKEMAETLIRKGMLRFFPSVPNIRAAAVYNEHSIFVNATPTGSFDKSVLEAASCGVPVLSCNSSFRGFLPENLIFREDDSGDLADKISEVLSRSKEELATLGEELRESVVREQSLSHMISAVLSSFK